jgi:hypothetical protein
MQIDAAPSSVRLKLYLAILLAPRSVLRYFPPNTTFRGIRFAALAILKKASIFDERVDFVPIVLWKNAYRGQAFKGYPLVDRVAALLSLDRSLVYGHTNIEADTVLLETDEGSLQSQVKVLP